MSAEWIQELCPEIADWQVELIAEHIEQRVASEREACAKVCEDLGRGHGFAFAEFDCAAAIRARGEFGKQLGVWNNGY